jgi:mRNA-degrading endonuclease RelE of RelBE toxin-antitoxin system
LDIADSPYDPHHNANRLHGAINYYRLRIGDWRALYRTHTDALIIEVVTLGHKREVYQ